MSSKIIKIVLPNGTEFVRHVAETILSDKKADKDTVSKVSPLITRAKSLVNQEGFFIAEFERSN